MTEPGSGCRTVVLISGRGSNLQSLIEATAAGRTGIHLCAVISDQASAGGLELARAAGIPTHVVSRPGYPDRAAFDQALAGRIDACGAGLIVLAGFMRVLGPEFVDRYSGRVLNLHPSLLPAYPGLHTHQRVLDAGGTEHGCSIHFVTAELDGGPVIAQAVIAVSAEDDAGTLARRVQEQEHRLLPLVVGWYAAGRLQQEDGAVRLDGHRLGAPVRIAAGDPLPA